MTIGIPKSLLYYKYKDLWQTFFTKLGCNVVYSPETTEDILESGKSFIVDESCLSMKVYMGHFNYLIGKCDYILVPHLENLSKNEELCTNFYALYDLARNIFDTKIIHYTVNVKKKNFEKEAFIKMGLELGFNKKEVLSAYKSAKEIEKIKHSKSIIENKTILKDKNSIKILLVGHHYNIYDKLIGKPIIKLLESMDIKIVYAHFNDVKDNTYKKISKGLYWTFNKELVNGVIEYKDKVDGIILLTVFPCGPDSLVNEVILRNLNIPMIQLIIDELNSETGFETRLESFVDILTSKRRIYEKNN